MKKNIFCGLLITLLCGAITLGAQEPTSTETADATVAVTQDAVPAAETTNITTDVTTDVTRDVALPTTPTTEPEEEVSLAEALAPVEQKEAVAATKTPSVAILEYQLTWYKKELEEYKKSKETATDIKKQALDQLIESKQQSIDELQQRITDVKTVGSDVIQLQQEIEQFKKEIAEHKEQKKSATTKERTSLDAIIKLKEGLIELKEDKIREAEKEVIFTKPVSYLESVVAMLEKEVAENKKALETADIAQKAVLEKVIKSKEELIKELKSNLSKRKTEQARAPGAVGNWQEQKDILQESIKDQNFIKDRVSPALKKVIDGNIGMKSNAIEQLDANITAGTTGGQIEKIASPSTESLDLFEAPPVIPTDMGSMGLGNLGSSFSTTSPTSSLGEEFTLDQPGLSSIGGTTLNGGFGLEGEPKTVKSVAQQIMPEFQQDQYLAKLGVPSQSPFSQTISVNNDMAQQFLGPVSTYQSQIQSTIQEQQQKAIERINIFKGEARQLQHQEECKKRLAASGCYSNCKKPVRRCKKACCCCC